MQLQAPELPPAYNPADSFLKGFALVAHVAAQRRENDARMQRMVLGEKVAQWQHQEDMGKLQLGERRLEEMQRQSTERAGQFDKKLEEVKYWHDVSEKLDVKAQTAKDAIAEARVQELKARAEKETVQAQQQKAVAYAKRIGDFSKTIKTYYPQLTLDQFDHPEQWKKNPADKQHWIRFQAQDRGMPAYTEDAKGNKQPIMVDATLHDDTYEHLMSWYQDLKKDKPQPQMLPSAGELDQQKDTALARQAIERGLDRAAITARYKEKYGVDLDSVQ